jgi:hypothetical protein
LVPPHFLRKRDGLVLDLEVVGMGLSGLKGKEGPEEEEEN